LVPTGKRLEHLPLFLEIRGKDLLPQKLINLIVRPEAHIGDFSMLIDNLVIGNCELGLHVLRRDLVSDD